MKIVVAIIACAVVLGVAEARAADAPPSASPAAASSKAGEEATEKRKVEDHIGQLRRELEITTSEDPQWERVAQTMRENAQDIDRVIDKRDAAIRTGTAIESLNSYADVVQAHAAAVKKLADAFAALYAEMSESQKKIADEVFSHRHHANAYAKR
jgi:hypothetical protein